MLLKGCASVVEGVCGHPCGSEAVPGSGCGSTEVQRAASDSSAAQLFEASNARVTSTISEACSGLAIHLLKVVNRSRCNMVQLPMVDASVRPPSVWAISSDGLESEAARA